MGLRQPSIQEQLDAMKMRSEQLRAEGNTAAADALDQQIQAKTAELAFGGRQQPLTAVPANQDISGMDNQPFEEPAVPESAMPETEMPEPVEESTPALQTTLPEPGKTAAIDEEIDQPPEETPDEFETMYKDYETARKQYGEDVEALGRESDEAATKQTMMTGIAGALQSFGEGLAAITGGSAKPLQTATETVRRMGEQGAAAREGRAKTLKERLMMARQPLEAKIEETKFRDVFEQRQMEKRLGDPNSKESQDAREVGLRTLDALVASFRSAGNDAAADELMSTKPFLEKASGKQIQSLFEQIKGLGIKPAISAETKQKYAMEAIEKKGEIQQSLTKQKQEFQAKMSNLRTDAARVNAATKQYEELTPKIQTDVREAKQLSGQIDKFVTLLEQASDPKIMSDEKKRRQINEAIAAQKEILNYMNARKYESKGVFTDQDLLALSQLKTVGTWVDQFSNWLSKGVYNEETAKQIRVMRDIMRERRRDFKNPGYAVAKGYAQVFRDISDLYSSMDNNVESARVYSKYADLLEKRFGPDIVGTFKDQKEFEEKFKSGQFKLENGDVVEIGGERFELINNMMEQIK